MSNVSIRSIRRLLNDTSAAQAKREAEAVKREAEAAKRKSKVMGAVAGGILKDNILNYAQKKGLYVLFLNGESVSIADSPEGFVPSIW